MLDQFLLWRFGWLMLGRTGVTSHLLEGESDEDEDAAEWSLCEDTARRCHTPELPSWLSHAPVCLLAARMWGGTIVASIGIPRREEPEKW